MPSLRQLLCNPFHPHGMRLCLRSRTPIQAHCIGNAMQMGDIGYARRHMLVLQLLLYLRRKVDEDLCGTAGAIQKC